MMSAEDAAESDLALVGDTHFDGHDAEDDDELEEEAMEETLGDDVTTLLRNTVQVHTH